MKRTGVVLRRLVTPEGNASVLLFLRSSGPLWVRLPGASRGSVRFGGAAEPLVWGAYQLQRTRTDVYLREAEVKEDFWELRSMPNACRQALHWCSLLSRNLLRGFPYDSLLPLLYWSTAALVGGAPPGVVSVRFLWRWLDDWGMAPELERCSLCGDPAGKVGLTDAGPVCPACGAETAADIAGFGGYVRSPSAQPPEELAGRGNDAEKIAEWMEHFFELNR